MILDIAIACASQLFVVDEFNGQRVLLFDDARSQRWLRADDGNQNNKHWQHSEMFDRKLYGHKLIESHGNRFEKVHHNL